MPSLLGQADVKELWNHSMWNEGGGEFSDDGGSFGESDRVSDANVHTSDSDVDEPEGEDEDEDKDEGGGEEEVLPIKDGDDVPVLIRVSRPKD